MSRFQPTQGPGNGFNTTEDTGFAVNDGNAGVKGEAKGLITNATDGQYSEMTPPIAAQVAVGLCGILLADVGANLTGKLCVSGRCKALLGTGGALLNSLLTIDVANGSLDIATTGQPVVARALEAGLAGNLIEVDFDGDHGFGVAP